jgi:peptidase E
METVRQIDAEHLQRIGTIHAEYAGLLRFAERRSLAGHRREVARIIRRADALGIAGGHVAVLLNRLEMFGIADALGDKTVLGWSAGAMVLCERIVVYHDTPPQGPGNAELLESGLGLCRGVVALPHARTRLRLDDAARVTRFAERWAPDRCVALDDGARLTLTNDGWSASRDTCALAPAGTLEELAA